MQSNHFNQINHQLFYQQMRDMLLLFLVLSLNAATLHSPQSNTPSIISNHQLSGFPDETAQYFGSQKINTLINFINTGASFYRDDLLKNLEYIQVNMQIAFAKRIEVFGVIIQSNSTSSVTGFYLGSQFERYASLKAGVCSINPTWSYLVYQATAKFGWVVQYAQRTGQGKDFDPSLLEVINGIILKKEGEGDKCTCKDINRIGDEIEYLYDFTWNVVCHSAPITEAYVPMTGKQWASTKPGRCYYLVFHTAQ